MTHQISSQSIQLCEILHDLDSNDLDTFTNVNVNVNLDSEKAVNIIESCLNQ